MGFWWWVLIFAGIGLAALVLCALLGLSLWRKAKIVMADLARISALAGEAGAAMNAAGRPAGPDAYDDLHAEVGDPTSSVHDRRHAR